MRLSQRLVALHVAGIVDPGPRRALERALGLGPAQPAGAAGRPSGWSRAGSPSFRTRLRTLVNDYSIWDEAYEAAMTGDRAWLYSNIGNAAAEIGTLDLIYFVDPDNRRQLRLAARLARRRASPGCCRRRCSRRSCGAWRTRSRRTARARVMATFAGEPWVFSAARVRPVDGVPTGVPLGDAADPGPRHAPFGRPARADRPGPAGRRPAALADSVAPGKASLPLVDYAGRTIDYITWEPPRPGADILRKVALPLGLALLLVSVVGAISSRYAVRSARSLERALLRRQGRRPQQDRVPVQRQPRAPDADERHPGRRAAAADHPARRRAARARRRCSSPRPTRRWR